MISNFPKSVFISVPGRLWTLWTFKVTISNRFLDISYGSKKISRGGFSNAPKTRLKFTPLKHPSQIQGYVHSIIFPHFFFHTKKKFHWILRLGSLPSVTPKKSLKNRIFVVYTLDIRSEMFFNIIE